VIEPGHVGFDINGDTWIGPFEATHTPYARVEQLAELLNRAGLRVIPLQDARGAQWTKLIFNASTNPVGALTLLHHGGATRFSPTGALFNALIAEGEAVAKALGIELHGDPRALVQKGANAPGKHKASMLQDILARRQTEVDFMNGAIADLGEKTGVPTPLHRALWQLVKGLEHSWTDPS
jgi:2-dehydropantoate 2-reductase